MAISVSSSSAAIYQIANLKPNPPRIILSLRPKGTVKCATIEDIEAEKSLIEKNVKERMEKTIENVRANFSSIRTGRSNPAMLDKIEVEYYGTSTSLKSIAQISTPDSSSLLVNPYDKSSLKAIEKAIINSDLGMTPGSDGDVLRLSIPQLTAERRKELLKMVAKQAEEGKGQIQMSKLLKEPGANNDGNEQPNEEENARREPLNNGLPWMQQPHMFNVPGNFNRGPYAPYDTIGDITKKLKIVVPDFDERFNTTNFVDWISAIEEYFDWYYMSDE
ncbi:hypothetical protein AgCh_034809 [Apium graveolens]